MIRDIEFPVDDEETREDFDDWLRSEQGKWAVAAEFIKGMNVTGYGKNTDMVIDDIFLKEHEL